MKKKDFSKMSIEELIKNNYLEIIGKNPEGEDVFRFTDKFLDENPEMIESYQSLDSDLLLSIWFKGFIDISMDEDSDAYISLTPKATNWMKSKELNDKEKIMMCDIIVWLSRKEK